MGPTTKPFDDSDGPARPNPESAASAARMARIVEPPLAVDLDGTLVTTDTQLEATLGLIRRDPLYLLSFIAWLFRGRAGFKAELAAHYDEQSANMPRQSLPWRKDLVDFLESQKRSGRKIILATAANEATASRAAAALGLFHEVLASTGALNLKGARKRDQLVRRYGIRGFDYIGDSRAYIPVWQACRIGHVAGTMTALPSAAIRNGAEQGQVFSTQPPKVRTWIRAVRIHQWGKNLLVFIAALLNHHLALAVMARLAVAFLAFSLIASAGYLLNDLFDLQSDRNHPNKRRRPLASGQISILSAIASIFVLTIAGLVLGTDGGPDFVACLVIYMGVAGLYSVYLKGKPIIDVITLAILYTLRVFAGGVVSGAYISPWLFQFSIFLFLSLAFMKRYSELMRLKELRRTEAHSRGYRLRDLHVVSQAGVASGAVAGLVLALYVNGQDVERLYPRPRMLWAVCPLFVYWIIRAWLVAHRGNMSDDPIVFALRDKVSYIVGGLVIVAVVLGLVPGILPNVH